jgi:hypothetical protein
MIKVHTFTKSGPRTDHRGVDLTCDGLPFYAYHSGERARLAKNESLKSTKA